MQPDPEEQLPPALYIVATPIGNLGDVSKRALDILIQADCIACEDTRTTGKLLARYEISNTLISYHDHNEIRQAVVLADKIANGQSVALVSDAGTPTLSDPGFRAVRECQKRSLPVSPIPGPSAAITALSASGLPSDRFTFIGFLPAKTAARKRFFEEHKNCAHTLILYESNHRILKFMDDLLEVIGSNRTISVSRELTKLHETIVSGPSGEVAEQIKKRSQKGEFVVVIATEGFQL